VKKKPVIYFSGISVVLSVLLLIPVKLPYTVYGTGKIFAINEWVLGRTEDGRITSTIKNNKLGIITSYGRKEYQQRDIYNFYLEPSIGSKLFVTEGDKVGHLESIELQKQLIALRGELEVEKANLLVFSTGQKPETVLEAQANISLSQERLEVQTKLFERAKNLYKDSLISIQDYDLEYNNYEMARINLDYSKAKYQSIITGEKPELIILAKKKINALELQIANLEERLEDLTIRAPFSGMLQYKKGDVSTVEPLVNLLDTSTYIIIAPIRAKDLRHVYPGQKAVLDMFSSGCKMEATIIHVDNSMQVVRGRQAAYVTAIVDTKCSNVLPGAVAQTIIYTDYLTPYQYLERVTASLFYR
jgi:multidrug efflux pump subunit AcrA (membrane-fusion protein)